MEAEQLYTQSPILAPKSSVPFRKLILPCACLTPKLITIYGNCLKSFPIISLCTALRDRHVDLQISGKDVVHRRLHFNNSTNLRK